MNRYLNLRTAVNGALFGLTITAASFAYFGLVRVPSIEDRSLSVHIDERLNYDAPVEQSAREAALIQTLSTRDLLPVHVMHAQLACARFDLASCTDETMNQALDRAFDTMSGGFGLAPVRALASACLGLKVCNQSLGQPWCNLDRDCWGQSVQSMFTAARHTPLGQARPE